MKWEFIGILSLGGALIGIASLWGMQESFEAILWLLLALFSPVFIARQTSNKVFLHGLASGIGMGLLHSLIQVLFFETYLKANPQTAKEFFNTQFPFSPRFLVAVIGPVVGILYGTVIGSFAVIAKKFHQPA